MIGTGASNATGGLTFLPELGPGLILLSAAILLALSLRIPRRAAAVGPLVFRLIAIGALVTVAFNPSTFHPAPMSEQKPGVVILLDQSLSMSLTDAPCEGEVRSRYDAARTLWLEPAKLDALSARADVRLLSFDERIEGADATQIAAGLPDGETSRIARAVQSVLGAASEGDDVTDVLLLTDGIDTDGSTFEDLGTQASAAGIRVNSVAVGSETRPTDVIVTASPASPFVYDGQPTTISVRLRQTGLSNRPVRLELRDGGPDGAVLHRETLLLDPSRPVTETTFEVVPTVDEASGDSLTVRSYHVRAEPIDGEADETNNERYVFMQVASDRIKVAVFEAEPYWDTTFFIRAMREDPQVEVTTVIGLGRVQAKGRERVRAQVTRYVPDALDGREETDLPIPLSEDALNAFDVIVLGRGIHLFFPGEDAGRLARFVTERGGSLIMLRGPATELDAPPDSLAGRAGLELEAISPLSWGYETYRGSKLYRTDAGRRETALDFERFGSSDVVLRELPDMLSATEVKREKALSVVWLRQSSDRTDGTAAVSHMSVGRGRTLAVLTDGMWRWAFLPPSLAEYSSVYAMFWSRTIRWLALGGDFLPGQSVSLNADQVTVSPGDPVTLAVRTRFVEETAFDPTLRVIGPDGSIRAVDLAGDGPGAAQQTGVFVPDQEGVYEAVLLTPGIAPERLSTRFAAYDTRVELLDTVSRRDELAALARVSNGRAFGLEEFNAFLDQIEDEVATRRSQGRMVAAWDRPWVFAVIVLLLATDWIWRRRIGLA